eukprot:CAMPEP_0172469154 /NCGR_PEP_ID=MMETSP1065-20121228/63038_1 /TAXON_ID=265537 /ORGANISM="Amphiprora paludosa, Strain CCMP125" /LENGTH=155 /DNA_ID=CAMNT_0013226729 /DNA_START=96 /DNA_END=561 /DNA_ORIENTATION=+
MTRHNGFDTFSSRTTALEVEKANKSPVPCRFAGPTLTTLAATVHENAEHDETYVDKVPTMDHVTRHLDRARLADSSTPKKGDPPGEVDEMVTRQKTKHEPCRFDKMIAPRVAFASCITPHRVLSDHPAVGVYSRDDMLIIVEEWTRTIQAPGTFH